MKKFLPALVSISFLAVLMVPTMTLAAECGNCVTPPASPSSCTCGANVLDAGTGLYCYNSTVYSSQSACIAAAGTGGTGGAGTTVPGAGITTIEGLLAVVNRVVTYVFTFVLAVAAIFVMFAGFNFMTAAGDETKIKKARGFLTNALIGIAIAIGVKGLMMIIAGLLNITLPAFQF